ncbi:hypothetical protein BD289DRAFT_114025 [Coniella lustricola]|uniref:Uncharacterized protein n=1 Tax=Coniella lustricola TaxID=2025994 RepID=A0A2T3AGE4_9PEZI|nr:hypothetical protein BD289DRAFT_114025 [Coniella lustricola]
MLGSMVPLVFVFGALVPFPFGPKWLSGWTITPCFLMESAILHVHAVCHFGAEGAPGTAVSALTDLGEPTDAGGRGAASVRKKLVVHFEYFVWHRYLVTFCLLDIGKLALAEAKVCSGAKLGSILSGPGDQGS